MASQLTKDIKIRTRAADPKPQRQTRSAKNKQKQQQDTRPKQKTQRQRPKRDKTSDPSGGSPNHYRGEAFLGNINGNAMDWSLGFMQELNPQHVSDFTGDGMLKNEIKKYTMWELKNAKIRLLATTGNNAATGSTCKAGFWSDFDSPGGPNNVSSLLKMQGRSLTIGQSGVIPIHTPRVAKLIDPTSTATTTWSIGSICVGLIGATQGVVNMTQNPDPADIQARVWTGPLWQIYLQYEYIFTGPTDASSRGTLLTEEIPAGTEALFTELPGEPVTMELVPAEPDPPALKRQALWRMSNYRQANRQRLNILSGIADLVSGLAGGLPPPFGQILGGGIGLVRKIVGVRHATYEVFADLSAASRDQPVLGISNRTFKVPFVHGRMCQFTDPQPLPTATTLIGIEPQTPPHLYGIEDIDPDIPFTLTIPIENFDGESATGPAVTEWRPVETPAAGIFMKLMKYDPNLPEPPPPALTDSSLQAGWMAIPDAENLTTQVYQSNKLIARVLVKELIERFSNGRFEGFKGLMCAAGFNNHYKLVTVNGTIFTMLANNSAETVASAYLSYASSSGTTLFVALPQVNTTGGVNSPCNLFAGLTAYPYYISRQPGVRTKHRQARGQDRCDGRTHVNHEVVTAAHADDERKMVKRPPTPFPSSISLARYVIVSDDSDTDGEAETEPESS
uniref:Capsid protein n=1 Tax=Yancheng grey stingfish astrovirus TaxID=2116114 RepID=A0A2P1GMG4_9VIRU|nr:capsid protein [Yancheng grey stingfish astrovirus]